MFIALKYQFLSNILNCISKSIIYNLQSIFTQVNPSLLVHVYSIINYLVVRVESEASMVERYTMHKVIIQQKHYFLK